MNSKQAIQAWLDNFNSKRMEQAIKGTPIELNREVILNCGVPQPGKSLGIELKLAIERINQQREWSKKNSTKE